MYQGMLYTILFRRACRLIWYAFCVGGVIKERHIEGYRVDFMEVFACNMSFLQFSPNYLGSVFSDLIIVYKSYNIKYGVI